MLFLGYVLCLWNLLKLILNRGSFGFNFSRSEFILV